MAKNTYETLLILDSNLYARDPGGVTKQLSEIFTEAGGEVLVSRLWMEQKLAYPIGKHQKGTYWLVYSEFEGAEVPKIDRALKLFEPVLRQMTLKIEPRLVEAILANARGQAAPVMVAGGGEEPEGEAASDDKADDKAPASDD